MAQSYKNRNAAGRPPGATSFPRIRREDKYRKLSLEALLTEREKRHRDPTHTWAYQFRGRPNDFIREIVGPEWNTKDWLPWRAFVNAIFGLPFGSAEEEQIYYDCTKRTELPAGPFKEVWAVIGRRGGKSRVFSLISAYLAVCFDWSQHLVPGERGVIPLLADARDRAQQAMGYVKATFEHPKLAPLLLKEPLQEEVFLRNNVDIRVTTASIKAARSRTVLSGLCDEIAFWKSDELGANPDKEIIGALRPAMITIPGSVLFCLSSPYARRGELYEHHRKFFSKNDPNVLVWQAPTTIMHPTVDRAEIKRAYDDDPAQAAAEYGAQFRSDVESILTREIVESCIVAGRYELAPQPRTIYKGFVDPSGGSGQDSMTLAIAHYDAENKVSVLDCVREVKPDFSPHSVAEEFSNVIKSYGLAKVVGDHFAGEWPRESFALCGVEYALCEQNKSQLYQAAVPLFNSKKIVLLDHAVMKTQFTSLERKTRSGGRDNVDHPSGGHDDVCNAVAGVLSEVAYQGGEIWTRPWAFPGSQGGFTSSAVGYASQVNQRRGRMR